MDWQQGAEVGAGGLVGWLASVFSFRWWMVSVDKRFDDVDKRFEALIQAAVLKDTCRVCARASSDRDDEFTRQVEALRGDIHALRTSHSESISELRKDIRTLMGFDHD